MNGFLQDLRYGARMLVRSPGFTLVAVATLALGIGANSAIFTVVQTVLLRPLPMRDPASLVMVWEDNRNTPPEAANKHRNVVNPGNFLRWRERNQVFERMAAYTSWNANLTGTGEPDRLDIAVVSGSFFSTLGTSAARGRTIQEPDGVTGAPDVVVLSDAFWRARLDADPGVVGRTLTLDDKPHTVVGVLPAEFDFPGGAQLYVALTEHPAWRDSPGRWMAVTARLKPGVSPEQAQKDMDRIALALEKERPQQDTGWGVKVTPLHADVVREVRPALLALAAAVGFVLLIACVNVANLLLARAVARERELAIRSSLGASPLRLLRQLFTESLLLAALGAGAGLFVATWALAGLLAMLPVDVPSLPQVKLDSTAVLFTLLLSVVSAIVFGIVPAWHAMRPAVAGSLQEGRTVAGAGRGRRRMTNLLVMVETALAVVLLVGAGLFAKSFWKLSHVDPGFDPSQVLTFQISLPNARYDTAEKQLRFYRDAVHRLAALPGVEAVGGMSWEPMGMGSATDWSIPGRPPQPPGQELVADVRMVTPGIFEALHIPLKRGRYIKDTDTADTPRVVVIGEETARRHWPLEDPIGKKIEMEWYETHTYEIVGIVGDVYLKSLEEKPRETLYFPVSNIPNDFMSMMVRASGKAGPGLAAIKREIAAVDPSLPLAKVRSLDEVVSRSLAIDRFLLLLLGVFSGVALLLAVIGLYGVLSYAVGQRQPEVGVRVALGAGPADIRRLFLKEGFLLAVSGLAAGGLGALVLSRLFTRFLYEVHPTDPVAYVEVALLLLGTALLAAWLPARRAARIDPSVALRAE
ncbi:MAG TPA: ABC transporter permease [Candidatus Polarisedimenticolaceae bacterium]|nr:ABC transporter permease [Candidatus Polarisedimenticolaceae bacterium]